jgi:hypothetical protein
MEKNQNLEWMLWQISVAENEQPPAYHLVHAICYFIEKYGQVPNRCEVYEGVEITHTKSVQNNSLMLTFDESLEAHKTKIY